MNYSTLLAHLELENSNKAVCAVSALLAETMAAEVIGVAACQPVPCFGDVSVGEVMEQDRIEITRELSVVEAQFRAAMDGHAREISFRSDISYANLEDFIATQARAADLIVTGPAIQYDLIDNTRRTDIGSLVMRAGRPVLIVPPKVKKLDLESVVIAWKDSREARRAVADALPLLKRADNITIVEIAPEANMKRAEARLKDVASWLARHGIGSEIMVHPSGKRDVDCLYQVLEDRHCDLVVAGAYSHSRLREWGFGGVTMDLLMSPDRCALLSH